MIKREYHSLESAASKIEYSIDDLIYLGSTGEIQIIALTTGLKGILFNRNSKPISEMRSLDFILDPYCFVPSEALIRYQSDKTRGKVNNKIQILNTPDNSGNYWVFNGEKDGIPINGSSLFILEATFEALSGKIVNQLSIINQSLSPNHLESIKHTASNKLDWKIPARAIGIEVHRNNPRDNLESIAKKTHNIMKSKHAAGEPGMITRSDKIPDPQTIKRHALNKIKT